MKSFWEEFEEPFFQKGFLKVLDFKKNFSQGYPGEGFVKAFPRISSFSFFLV